MNKLTIFLSHNWYLVAAFGVILVLLIANELKLLLSGIKNLSPEQVTQLINRQNAVIIDIRERAAYNSGHIINAINLTKESAVNDIEKLQKYKDQPIIIICATGQQCHKTAHVFLKQGFKQVACLKGGMSAWRSANLPLVKG